MKKKIVVAGSGKASVFYGKTYLAVAKELKLRERDVARAAKRWARTVEMWQLEMEPWDQPTRGLKRGVLQNVETL